MASLELPESQDSNPNRWTRCLARTFALLAMIAMAIDTTPGSTKLLNGIQGPVNDALNTLGLAQGDWPLFAPNPSVRNHRLLAELRDANDHPATWSSPEWTRASIWEKFYRSRDMNFYQRLGRNVHASSDFADYLHRAIPVRESATPSIRFDDQYEVLPMVDLAPPIQSIRLYEYQRRLLLTPGEPLPDVANTNWTNHSVLLSQRKYDP
ncbi:MAG: hypothetical protein ACK5OB_05500 [Pirellula sp.]